MVQRFAVRALISLVVTTSLIGCGGSNTSTTAQASTSSGGATTTTASAGGETHEHHEHQEGGHEGEHGAMPETIHAYHEILRPLWHSPVGAERDNQSCTQAPTLVTRAHAIMEANPPATLPADRVNRYMTASAQLSATTDALQTACTATPRGNVAGALEAAHTAFHGLIETLETSR